MTKSLKLSGFPRPGAVVEFLQDNEAHIAWVLEESQGRLRLLTRTKREVKLPAARLLPWLGPEFPPGATREEIGHRLEDIEARRRGICAEVNPMELWDMAQGEVEHAPAEWFSQLLWTEPGVDEVAGMGRALLSAKAHFKFQPPDFDIHPADKVEARLAREREDKDREAVASAGHAILSALWARIKSRQPPLSPHMVQREAEGLDPDLEALLRAMLLAQWQKTAGGPGGEYDALAKLWESLKKSLNIKGETPHLACSWPRPGRAAPAPLPSAGRGGLCLGRRLVRGLCRGNRRATGELRRARRRGEAGPHALRQHRRRHHPDIDDAFSWPKPPCRWFARIPLPRHPGRPGLAGDCGAPLDREVRSRATSLNLPEGSGHMMPEELGTGLFSLTADGPKPALVAEFLLDERAEIVDTRPRLAWVKLARNIAYPDAQAAIEANNGAGSDPQLSLALRIARELFARRLERGAVVIDKPEPQVELSGEAGSVSVDIALRQTSPDAELLVSEFMILANSGLALWARENGVPLLCRTQDIALAREATGVFSDPVDIFRVVKLLAPPLLERQPRRHAALACEAYATITSPIRRYVDFLNMAQVQSFLECGAPRLDAAAVDALIPHLSARIQEVGQVQRFRPRYWKLVYLAQRKRQPFPAVVVDDAGPYPTLSLPDVQITTRVPRSLLGDRVQPGMRFDLVFGRIDPLANELKVVEALEAE
jgi:exoribonuclease-2